jgi:hypothetical protein
MMTLKIYPNGEPYEAPDLCVVPCEAVTTICATSAEGDYIEPGTSDNWGSF